MIFNSKKELLMYLKYIIELGYGSQGITYHDKKLNKAIKVYHEVFDDEMSYLTKNKEETLKFNQVVNNTYIFPDDVLTEAFGASNTVKPVFANTSAFPRSPYSINPTVLESPINKASSNNSLLASITGFAADSPIVSGIVSSDNSVIWSSDSIVT